MSRSRDTQRKRIYDAEDTALLTESAAAKRLLHNGKRVTSTGNISIEACQAYVDHVTSAAWFQRRWGVARLRVKHKVHGKATGGYGRVTLPPWARNEATILHEIAHGLVPGACAWHGPEFAAIYLTLVKHTMGAESYANLRASMRERRVRVAALPKPDPNRVARVVPRAAIEAKAARAAREEARATREQRQREREASHRRQTGRTVRQASAACIRALVKDGHFGPAGSAGRKAALATARALESVEMSRSVRAARGE